MYCVYLFIENPFVESRAHEESFTLIVLPTAPKTVSLRAVLLQPWINSLRHCYDPCIIL